MLGRFEKSPYYPLPPDYPDLAPDAQKAARLNALRLQETPEDLTYAWAFFRSYYLQDDPEAGFFSGWYKKYTPSPPVHYQTIYDVGAHRYNCFGYPRDFAKSTIFMELAMTLFLGRDNFWISLIYSRLGLVQQRFANQLMHQFTHNERILEDFGKIKPGQQEGQWSASALTNGITRSQITGHPVKGALLGLRPDLILVDDCEYDDELKVAPTELIEHMDRFIHNVVLPMQTAGHTAIAILGTLYYRRCWIARWLHASENDDDRVRFWNRRLYSAEDRNADGSLLWEAKFSQEVLDRDKEILKDAYAAQRLNKPGEANCLLKLHPWLSLYCVENEDQAYSHGNPLSSGASLVSYKKATPTPSAPEAYDKLCRPFGATVGKMNRMLFMDYAGCKTSTSDYVAMVVIGIENTETYRDHWWVLDVYMGRIRGEPLFRQLFQMGMRWRTKYICIEAVAAQALLIGVAQAYSTLWEHTGWRPRILPVEYPRGLAKEDRISSLAWRFDRNRIRLPDHLRARNPGVRALFQQVKAFTGQRGGLAYDDVIDTLAMPQYILASAPKLPDDRADPALGLDLMKSLNTDGTHTEQGLWLGSALLPSECDAKTRQRLFDDYNTRTPKGTRTWTHHRRPMVPRRSR